MPRQAAETTTGIKHPQHRMSTETSRSNEGSSSDSRYRHDRREHGNFGAAARVRSSDQIDVALQALRQSQFMERVHNHARSSDNPTATLGGSEGAARGAITTATPPDLRASSVDLLSSGHILATMATVPSLPPQQALDPTVTTQSIDTSGGGTRRRSSAGLITSDTASTITTPVLPARTAPPVYDLVASRPSPPPAAGVVSSQGPSQGQAGIASAEGLARSRSTVSPPHSRPPPLYSDEDPVPAPAATIADEVDVSRATAASGTPRRIAFPAASAAPSAVQPRVRHEEFLTPEEAQAILDRDDFAAAEAVVAAAEAAEAAAATASGEAAAAATEANEVAAAATLGMSGRTTHSATSSTVAFAGAQEAPVRDAPARGRTVSEVPGAAAQRSSADDFAAAIALSEAAAAATEAEEAAASMSGISEITTHPAGLFTDTSTGLRDAPLRHARAAHGRTVSAMSERTTRVAGLFSDTSPEVRNTPRRTVSEMSGLTPTAGQRASAPPLAYVEAVEPASAGLFTDTSAGAVNVPRRTASEGSGPTPTAAQHASARAIALEQAAEPASAGVSTRAFAGGLNTPRRTVSEMSGLTPTAAQYASAPPLAFAEAVEPVFVSAFSSPASCRAVFGATRSSSMVLGANHSAVQVASNPILARETAVPQSRQGDGAVAPAAARTAIAACRSGAISPASTRLKEPSIIARGDPSTDAPTTLGPLSCAACEARIESPSHRTKDMNGCKCRNCWRNVCDACIGAFWPRSMVPARYTDNIKSHRMRICGTCDDAMKDFRTALLLGREDDAMAAYKTGCVNTETPYSIYHGELPVHCAAAGGSVCLLSWLVDELGCELFEYVAASGGFFRTRPVQDRRMLTVLGAAAVNLQLSTMEYLVTEKGCSLSEIKHVPTLKKVLKLCLLGAPKSEMVNDRGEASSGGASHGASSASPTGDMLAADAGNDLGDDDCCIVCFDNDVDCTIVPCGHHCCCFGCAKKVHLCPMCRTRVRQRIKAISVY